MASAYKMLPIIIGTVEIKVGFKWKLIVWNADSSMEVT